MADKTYTYCGHCKRYLGIGDFSQCQYCGSVFNIKESLGTITHTVVETKLDTRLLKYTITVGLGAGGFACATAFTLSAFSHQWAALFSSLATSFTWQLALTLIFFSVFFSVLKALFWEKIDHLLLSYENWTVYNFLQRFRRFLAPLAHHRRIGTILLLIIASIIALPVLAWKFNRLDLYDLSFNILTNILGGLLIILIEDLISQKERIKKEKNWVPPPTSDDFKRDKNWVPPS
jgi:hypothetical protein